MMFAAARVTTGVPTQMPASTRVSTAETLPSFKTLPAAKAFIRFKTLGLASSTKKMEASRMRRLRSR
jgi:hypothetical protein